MLIRLARYVSAPGLVALILVAVALLVVYQQLATRALLEQQARSNVSLTRSFANTIWPRYKEFALTSADLSPEELRQQPWLRDLNRDVQRQMTGLDAVKVKLYALNGLTLFSTEPDDIGVDKSGNAGFLAARAGDPASEIVFRNQMYGFERLVVDANLVASYVPIRDRRTGEIEAVFEVYSDVTELVQQMNATKWKIGLVVFGGMLLVCMVFFYRAGVFMKAWDAEREEAERRMRHQAYHDSLTDLPNRLSFQEQIETVLSRGGRGRKPIAVMFVDLDRFKLVNDSLSHHAGDLVLQAAASRIKRALRSGDTLFRMGGDEFTVITRRLTDEAEAAQVAQRILSLFDKPFRVLDREILVTASIGIVLSSNDPDVNAELLKKADLAMYQAKAAGRNRYAFYDADVELRASQRLDLETNLQKAMANNEFFLQYQPRVCTETGLISGCEALLRWRHPRGELVPPLVFVPVLEDSGLIVPVGRWVLRRACEQAKEWQEEGWGKLRVSVNISVVQFNEENFVAEVDQILGETGLDPSCLELEITENVLIADVEKVVAKLEQLKGLGVSISIDDFGTGYSSLSYLRNFPIDFLKVDQSFIQHVTDNDRNASITNAIAALAENLDLRMVAEGVEQDGQVTFLKTVKCAEMQGYLFSTPLDVDGMREFLLRQRQMRPARAEAKQEDELG